MAVGKDKGRIMISLSKDLLDKVEMVSEKYGLTKSGMCAYWIGQGCYATLKAWETLEKMPEMMVLKEGGENQLMLNGSPAQLGQEKGNRSGAGSP